MVIFLIFRLRCSAYMWILGNPIKIEGMEFSKTRGIYICNHASPLDIFLVMWLTPTGTVGIAKKEVSIYHFFGNSQLIIWYPLFSQLYVLANHLRIDRSNPVAAIKSIKDKRVKISCDIEYTMHVQGFVHIALQSKLPIVPMVLAGTHLAWRKNSLRVTVRPAPLTVKLLPPIKTDDWVEDTHK
ncbi:1-acyl-sn-glycerol-3-phosphate acyltransferase-like isoform X1 [Carex littledalei]|uniref:1-acyl-sn-glycerol-3-phosphate acyltransferase-like isoform X1 n=1 Tax=Carex littledalei TaxID=544730 RepID=A0A833QUW8_9POAL|nr:1-acyl-sn-glycerol-3-phosphate acyltransferase-like isoform X1 [Carex littledalei]